MKLKNTIYIYKLTHASTTVLGLTIRLSKFSLSTASVTDDQIVVTLESQEWISYHFNNSWMNEFVKHFVRLVRWLFQHSENGIKGIS